MKPTNYILFFAFIILYACTSSQETTQQTPRKEPEVLVFDEVVKNDSSKTEIPDQSQLPKQGAITSQPVTNAAQLALKFTVQVGVFTSQERAQLFVNENQSKIAYLMNITLREADKMFVVRLKAFATREEAEMVKNNIRQIAPFKDAFIMILQ